MKHNEPCISVVVPGYNRADLIGRTLQSLLNLDYENYEIIVVDDGSTDNTEEVVKGFNSPRIQYVKKQNEERAAARNFGARLAKGEYVNFFDSDDVALPNHLRQAARLIADRNAPEWFHLGYAWADPQEKIFRYVNNYRGETLNHLIPDGNPLSCNGVFLRRDIILSFPFNQVRELSASEDYELWVRLAARFPLFYSNEVTSLVIDHEQRSVRRINGEKLIKRLNLLLQSLDADKKVQEVFRKDFSKIRADSYSYIALHLAQGRPYKAASVKYLTLAFMTRPDIIKKKRFYATLKNLLIKW